MPAGGHYMLYAWLPSQFGNQIMGMAPEEVYALVAPYFHQDQMVTGKDGDKTSAWYWFTRI
jgi:hypothetical protein